MMGLPERGICPGVASVQPPDDGGVMHELHRAARAAWPGIDLAFEVFARYVSSRLAERGEPEAAARQLRTSDLYLACACSRGDAQAIAAFEHHCLDGLGVTLRKMAGMTPDIAAEVKQVLRLRLLVGDTRPPGILHFSGRGELRRWLRVLAVREALVLTQRARRESPVEEEALEIALLPALDLEKEYLKKLYQKEFTHAITDALDTLTPRDQVVLRQVFVDGLNVDELGGLYHVHRATAARWLARAQVALSKRTRAILMRKLAVNPGELISILRLLRSGFELSLRLVFLRQKQEG
jgi:RNA polymerase sigma-70 factor, ECF subfamily